MKQYTLAAIVLCMFPYYMHAGVADALKTSQHKIATLKQNVKVCAGTQDFKLRCKQCNFRCRKCDKV